MAETIKDLFEVFPRPGRLDWIGIRPVRREAVDVVSEAILSETEGIQGDHYSGRSGNRHVTLIQAEHLPAIASFVGREQLDPALLRRNLVISGLNLLALKDKQIQVGEVVLQITGQCHPCSRMEETLGPGGYNAVRSHGGMTARVVQGGRIQVGDTVHVKQSSAPLPG
ncbi:MOSC domain-containing protein [Tellurirhabdus rosea]|uniref:MOSC domain-containing protein n=1 Tax=Tellurirhabdus rosea TaxID=2674997 RepID=UPI00225BF367|nr:MOSC domain-containing protein [Tellurirhabdus rosea]